MNNYLTNDNKPLVVIIAGPTATGKTKLAVELAKRFNGEIISGDSMQVYRKLDIGTAKVTEAEKDGIPHHLIDIREPNEDFSLSDFLNECNNAVKDIVLRNKLPIIAGGTGLYISSFKDNITLSESSPDTAYRDFLNSLAAFDGGYSLRELLHGIDPTAYNKLNINDIKRVQRAIETYRETGKTIAECNAESKKPSPYNFLMFGLNYSDRSLLYKGIDERVDKMILKGLVDEAKALDLQNCSVTARQAIGYRQLLPFFSGDETLEDAVEKIKKESRRYAKRQITWFKREKTMIWYNVDEIIFEEIAKKCSEHIEKSLEMCYNISITKL